MEWFRSFYQSRLSRLKLEIGLSLISILSAVVSVYLVFIPVNQVATPVTTPKQTSVKTTTVSKIMIDIEGAVVKPGAYSLHLGSRLKDALEVAGGLSQEADRHVFYQQSNLSKVLADEDKIYVPSLLDDASIGHPTSTTGTASNNALIDINSATKDELDSLPGIGSVIADKIIQGRPYDHSDSLVKNNIIGQSLFDKIKDLITAS